MSYLHLRSERGMNYTLNRALNDGTATAQIEESRAEALHINDLARETLDPGLRIVAQFCDVLGRRSPEEAAVFSTELRST
jgi:hypothetical protein